MGYKLSPQSIGSVKLSGAFAGILDPFVPLNERIQGKLLFQDTMSTFIELKE